jgi:hypothetical protein
MCHCAWESLEGKGRKSPTRIDVKKLTERYLKYKDARGFVVSANGS